MTTARSFTLCSLLSLIACRGEPTDSPAPVAESDVCLATGAPLWAGQTVAVWVDASAEDGGDGSDGAPLQGIQDGLDVAATLGGGLVAVAPGLYDENLSLRPPRVETDVFRHVRAESG